MKIAVGETEYTAEFTAFTPIAYSRCFNVVKANGTSRPKDIAESVAMIAESLASYGCPPMVPLLEIFFACIKTANPKFDTGFDAWVESFPTDAYDMGREDGWAADVMHIVEDNFFQSAKDAVEAAPAEKTASAASK